MCIAIYIYCYCIYVFAEKNLKTVRRRFFALLSMWVGNAKLMFLLIVEQFHCEYEVARIGNFVLWAESISLMVSNW